MQTTRKRKIESNKAIAAYYKALGFRLKRTTPGRLAPNDTRRYQLTYSHRGALDGWYASNNKDATLVDMVTSFTGWSRLATTSLNVVQEQVKAVCDLPKSLERHGAFNMTLSQWYGEALKWQSTRHNMQVWKLSAEHWRAAFVEAVENHADPVVES